MNTFWEIQSVNYITSYPPSATQDALAEKMQSVPGTDSLLFNRMMDNIECGRQRLKDIVEIEAREKEEQIERRQQQSKASGTWKGFERSL